MYVLFSCVGGCASGPAVCPDGTYSEAGQLRPLCFGCRLHPPLTHFFSPISYARANLSSSLVIAGANTCTTCPPGHYCPSPNLAPQACPVGTFSGGGTVASCTPCASGSFSSSTGALACNPCPAGHSCSSPGLEPVSCAAGTLSTGSQTFCATCAVGTYSAVGSSSCSLCPEGKHCADPATPTDCPYGTYSVGGVVSVCTACPFGMVSSSTRTGCENCPFGYSCGAPGTSPQQCSSGTYNNGTAGVCAPCPEGYRCPYPHVQAILCPAGTYSTLGSHDCSACPAGHYCPDSASTPLACDSGSFSREGDGSCSTCPAGKACLTPSSEPVECTIGHYALENSTQCTLCPPGSACPNTDAAPVACQAGFYSHFNRTVCVQCPAGFACVNNQAPVACQVGQFSLAGYTECSPCPAGYRCPTTDNSPAQCYPGTFAVAGSADCTACPRGVACPDPLSSTTTPCNSGSYSVGMKSECLPCPAGKACPFTDAAVEIDCALGYYSPGGQSTCTICPAGHMCPLAAVAPIACTNGWTAGGRGSCEQCPAGFSCSSSTSQITECASGTYSPAGQLACTTCPSGKYCPDVTSSTEITCPSGTYSTGGQAFCTACTPGYSCNSKTGDGSACIDGRYRTHLMKTCTICSAGHACADAGLPPVACRPGTYASAGATACQVCPAGSQCTATQASLCQAGTYSGSGFTACVPCPQGFLCDQAGSSAPLTTCPEGNYCPLGANQKQPCPAGTFRGSTGGGAITDCLTCPEGFYCSVATGTVTPVACPAGHICPSGTESAEQYPCPPGTYTNASASARLSFAACDTCPSGHYCLSGTHQPAICVPGYYCPDGTEYRSRSQTCSLYVSLSLALSYPAVSRTPTLISPLLYRQQYPCPAGTYLNSTLGTNVGDCLECPEGSYCPKGSGGVTRCPAGTYNPEKGSGLLSECLACPAGTVCSNAGAVTAGTAVCPAAHYCPAGSQSAIPCPPGTYSDGTSKTQVSDCQPCPSGSACPSGTGGNNAPLACAVGHYCPAGTPHPHTFACPPGTYSGATNAVAASDCVSCPVGKYCVGGQATVTGDCSSGHYCPLGTNSSRKFPCPAGTYTASTSLTSANQCDPCPQGAYCEIASVAPVLCPAGTFASSQNSESPGLYGGAGVSSFPACVTCTAGYKCSIAGTITPDPCPAGKYSDAGSDECSDCPAGYYCGAGSTPSSMQACPAGTFCSGAVETRPVVGSERLCTAGYYCPEGTVAPQACPPGTYSSATTATALSDCQQCTTGYYCLEGASGTTAACNAGHYCPAGSTGSKHVPCPAGTFRGQTGGRSQSDCSTCPAGSYCPRGSVTGQTCPEGYYCPSGSPYATPCPSGTFGNAQGLEVVANCTPCTGGSYCDGTALTAPTGLCAPGYYCSGGSDSPKPTNSTMGGICDSGGYCPAGSQAPVACPPGSYLANVTGSRSADDCIACIPGYYCSGAQVGTTAQCEAGWYCTGGSISSRQHATPPGHYSPQGSVEPIPCDAGTYSAQSNKGACDPCPAGFYCPDVGMTSYTDCPVGHFCDQGSYTPSPCPRGTYSNAERINSTSGCLACPPGKYCDTNGQTAPTGDCSAGYFCESGAWSDSPTTVGGYPCPAGYYCVNGTSSPAACPEGTFRAATRGVSASSCVACLPGHYCSKTGLAAPEGPCDAGYYCGSGAAVANPDGVSSAGNNGPCPAGSYCPQGSTTAIACAPGTYSQNAAQSSCDICPERFYCGTGVYAPQTCSKGSFCPAGSGVPQVCPVGTYNEQTGLMSSAECSTCTPGSYCGNTGLESPSGLCQSGYSCPSGAVGSQGQMTLAGAPVLCAAGHYCPEGTGNPLPCPAGTFLGSLGARTVSECQACPPGKYCNSTGLTQPVGRCSAGYFCSGGSDTSMPVGVASGDKCPTGFHCPEGSASPQNCALGTYAPVERLETCQRCPAGYTCNNTHYTPCPCGHYCPEGTGSDFEVPCDEGTINNLTLQTSVAACMPCPAGSYCGDRGRCAIEGTCSAGYYCSGSTTVATPSTNGGRCNAGTICPQGSTSPVPCPAGKYCPDAGASAPAGPCFAGYFCTSGSSSATPVDGTSGDVCPPGRFCPAGSSSPQPCPPGTFMPNTGTQSQAGCISCPAGQYCGDANASAVVGPCTAGYTCPLGTSYPGTSPSGSCPVAHKCPTGTGNPQPCSAGTYQEQPGQAACDICPAGRFCAGNVSVVSPVDCPAGYYCPAGTTRADQFPCPIGTFSTLSGVESASGCSPCKPGRYCASPGLTQPTGNCSAGYFCPGGQTAPANAACNGAGCPTVCPEGGYCPAGSAAFTPCEPGTFSTTKGGTNPGSCTQCPPGKYCATAGSTNPSTATNCAEGFHCFGGSNTPSPSDNVTGRPCPLGTYCPSGTIVELDCPRGTYGPSTARAVCPPCPAGFYCPDVGMNSSLDCPLGFYCDEGSMNPSPCPAGRLGTRLNLQNVTECELCPAGKFCKNLTQPSGACAAGYLCAAGSTSATPTGVANLTLNTNGVCPLGHYCEAGTVSAVPCNAGQYLNLVGSDEASDCQACPPGFACPESGMSQPLVCTEGYYCAAGSISVTAVECPAGTYCPQGSASPQPCPLGTYNSFQRVAICTVCPASKYCGVALGTITPLDCPQGRYCPLATSVPVVCPQGTYSNGIGMTNSTDCAVCPAGVYCNNGLVLGNCSAGYLCTSGNWNPTPTNSSCNLPLSSDTVGSVCPPGHYCVAGAPTAVPCPDNTLRVPPGGTSLTDCIACPQGYRCYAGNPVPDPCPPGYYCPPDGPALPCANGTYSATPAATSINTCLACPEGHWCYRAGVSDYTQYECPAGHYCLPGTGGTLNPLPLECPSGTFRNAPGGTSVNSCQTCPGGYYCLQKTSAPQVCGEGTYCPAGSSASLPCPAGSYCLPATANPVPCPPGYYCPAGADKPIYCVAGQYCPASSENPFFCPLGYASNDVGNRTSLDVACRICEAGYYNNQAANLTCSPCEAGYVCMGGSSSPRPTNRDTQKGYVCPEGHYCPKGSGYPFPCPAGTYNLYEGSVSRESCVPCEKGTFNAVAGSKACTSCARSSTSQPGATKCYCIGRKRVFQPSDQSCICETGHEFIFDGKVLSDEDGPEDCQSIVYDRCLQSESRDSTGKCVNRATGNCEEKCGGQPGRYSVALGQCECSNVAPIDAVCDDNCQKQAAAISYKDGKLCVTASDNIANQTCTDLTGLYGFKGQVNCPATDNCKVVPIDVSSGGLGGVYGVPPILESYQSLSWQLRRPRSTELMTVRSEGAGRHYHTMSFSEGNRSDWVYKSIEEQAEVWKAYNTVGAQPGRKLQAQASSSAPVINPALICLVAGEAALFTLTNGYPVYLKDSLLNTNLNFDYGYFRSVQENAARNASNLQMLAFTFDVAGVYVFGLSTDPDQQTIFVVTKPTDQCPTGSGRILPMTFSNMVLLGLKKNVDLVVKPDWELIMIMCLLIVLLFVAVVGGVYYFQTRAWSISKPLRAKYKEVARNDLDSVWNFNSQGSVLKMDSVSGGVKSIDALVGGGSSKVKAKKEGLSELDLVNKGDEDIHMHELGNNFDLEGFDFHSLYKMMDDSKHLFSGFFEKQESEMRAFYDRVTMETEHLKHVLAVKMHVQLNKSGEGFEDAVDRLVSGELMARQSFEDLSKTRELEMVQLLDELMVAIEGLRDDYNILPVKELVRLCREQLKNSQAGLRMERKRRKAFAAHVEICGSKIIDALVAADLHEGEIRDEYFGALQFFADHLDEILKRTLDREKAYFKNKEKNVDASKEVKKRAKDLYRRDMLIDIKAVR